MLPKVLAYITRETESGRELLLFRHPRHIKTPLQVPQGTVEEGEPIVDALWRELGEETGLTTFTLVAQIAQESFYARWRDEWQERNVFHLTANPDVPDEWAHVVSAGESDKGLRFKFFWLPIAAARKELHWSQNRWLHLI